MASVSHLEKQTEAVRCCRVSVTLSVCWVWKSPQALRSDVGMNLDFEASNSQSGWSSWRRCCWVKNWEGGAEIRKIFRWVQGLWEGFWLWLKVGNEEEGSLGVKSFGYTYAAADSAVKRGGAEVAHPFLYGWKTKIFLNDFHKEAMFTAVRGHRLLRKYFHHQKSEEKNLNVLQKTSTNSQHFIFPFSPGLLLCCFIFLNLILLFISNININQYLKCLNIN